MGEVFASHGNRFSIPTFFSKVTILGGILLVLSGLAYAFCAWRGETGKYGALGRDEISESEHLPFSNPYASTIGEEAEGDEEANLSL